MQQSRHRKNFINIPSFVWPLILSVRPQNPSLHSFEEHTMANSICTCLWFRDGRGLEAAEYYCSLIPGSRIEKSFVGDNDYGAFSVVDFTLGGVPYQILDAGPMFTLTEAMSISVATDDQAETDRLWVALTENGGEETACGWLKDRYGVSWQIFPRRLIELTTSSDKTVSTKAMAAMMKQTKIDIAEIEAAVRG
jgi:predicted 3-demethylubiquinone-9 3-methyltransferase (glyoxalase superfamily)